MESNFSKSFNMDPVRDAENLNTVKSFMAITSYRLDGIGMTVVKNGFSLVAKPINEICNYLLCVVCFQKR